MRSVALPEDKYIGLDFVEGKGVDAVLTDAYKLSLDDNSADVVVSSSRRLPLRRGVKQYRDAIDGERAGRILCGATADRSSAEAARGQTGLDRRRQLT